MTKNLEKAFSEASKLSQEDQDALAEWLLEELASERRWSKTDRKSSKLLEKLADEALREHREGGICDLDLDRS